MTYTENDLPRVLVDGIRSAATAGAADPTSQADLATGRAADRPRPQFFDNISAAEAVELYTTVRALRPAATAEIGFCCGGSGLSILKALEDNGAGRHHACDPYQTTYAKGAGLANVAAAGLAHRLELHQAFPEQVVPGFPRVQFAFIDASHLFDLSVLDFTLIDKRLDVGGVVGFHDLWMPSLQKLVRYILTNRDYRPYRVPGAAAPPPASAARRAVARVSGLVPGAARVFAPELLVPWGSYGFGNVALLQKTAEDTRDWRHFRRF